ncbi:MAG: hypothetical protein GX424_05375 [Clostridiales bacterium]|jgi:Na+-translocating ferredoxin:NAD+ oxidoreductase RnfE subunit|nr:hypothetical protein [Clostridiales bacterium]
MRRGLKKKIRIIFLNSAFFRNPVPVAALSIYPVIAAGYSLQNAVELSLLFLFLSVPVGFLFCLIGEMIPLWVRPAAVLAASAVFYLPAARLLESMIPGAVAALGMFGPLMICNSLILSRANVYAPSHIGWAVAADTLGCAVGFALVICLTGAVRGLWLSGSVRAAEGGVSLPFFGLIFVGFLAAFLQWVNRRRTLRTGKRGGRP